MTTRNHRKRFTARLAWGALVALFTAPVFPLGAQEAPKTTSDTAKATAAILLFHDEITDVTTQSLRRRIDEARRRGANLIVLDMDTPGGLVTSSIDIADMLRTLTGIRTVAWVNDDAYSGGSLVAVACDEIVMARSSRIGDSQVIMRGPEGVGAVPKDLQPKAYTPVVHDFRMSAKRNGYSEVLAEAFVIPEREVWWLENSETGTREFVFRDEKIRRLADGGSDGSDAADPQTVDDSPRSRWKLVQTYHDIESGKELPVRQPVVGDAELLLMSASEAYAYGFSKGIVDDEKELIARYNVGTLFRLEATWSENLAHWLTSMPVRGFLLMIVFLAGYMELQAPGLSVPGAVALVALAVFLGAPYLTGLANVWEIVMIVLGLVLIALELFVIPGFGVMGISGVVCVLTGIIATFVPDEPGRSFPTLFPALPDTMEKLKAGIVTLASATVASVIGMFMLSRYLPKMPLVRGLVPANPMPSDVLVEDPYRGAARVGDVGQAEGSLHPAGKARFGGLLVDVVTQGEYLEGDATVEVVERRGNRVVVRAVRQSG